MTLTLVPLGTNGFIPSFGRQTMSFLLRTAQGRVVLLDAGTGVARLLEPEVRRFLEGAEELTVVLTHYHLDHVVGLSYLPAVWRGRPVTVWGPERPLVDSSPDEALRRLVSPPLFPIDLDHLPLPVTIRSYGGDRLEVAGVTIRLRRQHHDGGSVGMVIDERLAYLTDCEMEASAADFARGVDLLLHDMWVTDAEVAAGASRIGHSTREDVARFADLTDARRVAAIHHLPVRPPDTLAAFVGPLAEMTKAETVVLVEGQPISV